MSGALRKTMGYFGMRERDQEEVLAQDSYDDAYLPEFARPELVQYEEPAPVQVRRIVTSHPMSYSDAKGIGDAFRSGTPVIMNLTGLSEAEARRLVDFASGLTYGLEGAIERVTSRVFLLSPADVTINDRESYSESESIFHIS